MNSTVLTTVATNTIDFCPFSQKQMAGLIICKFTEPQYNYLLDLLRITQLPDEIIEYILKFSVYSKINIGLWGLEPYTNFIINKSKSGRKIVKPIKFSQQSFVSGRYDTYDSQYYNGISYDKYESSSEQLYLTNTVDYDYLEEVIEEPDTDSGSDFELDEDEDDTDDEFSEDDCLD